LKHANFEMCGANHLQSLYVKHMMDVDTKPVGSNTTMQKIIIRPCKIHSN
jgi:hypothetical protein